MKKKLLLLSFLLSCICIVAQYVPNPQLGDFESRTTGNWNNASSWNRYNGSGWVAATSYPGEGTTSANQASYRVFVRPTHNITVNTSQTYYFGDLYILSCANNPTTNICSGYPTPYDANNINIRYGQVTLTGNQVNFKLLGNGQDVFIFGGKMFWATNNTILHINLGSSIVLTNYNGAVKEGGTNLLRPESTSDGCTGNQQIFFVNPTTGVTQVQYAVCNGNNSQYNFRDLNWGGGTIQAVPTTSAATICAGNPLTLNGSYTGYIPQADQAAGVQYIWSLETGPTGFSFATTTPSSSALQNLNLTIPGTYTFSLQARYYASQFSTYIYGIESVTIVVYPQNSSQCGCYKNPVTNTGVTIPSKMGITSLGRAGTNSDNWPMQRQSAVLVLESKTKGLVLNTVANTLSIQNPVEGMIVFDQSADAIKVYTTTDNGITFGWQTMQIPGCPTN